MPRYRVLRRINQGGDIYRPGDTIKLSRAEATALYLNKNFCIAIKDKKHLHDIKQAFFERGKEQRRKTLLNRADMCGVDRKKVEDELL